MTWCSTSALLQLQVTKCITIYKKNTFLFCFAVNRHVTGWFLFFLEYRRLATMSAHWFFLCACMDQRSAVKMTKAIAQGHVYWSWIAAIPVSPWMAQDGRPPGKTGRCELATLVVWVSSISSLTRRAWQAALYLHACHAGVALQALSPDPWIVPSTCNKSSPSLNYCTSVWHGQYCSRRLVPISRAFHCYHSADIGARAQQLCDNNETIGLYTTPAKHVYTLW